jgi:hypothetical protein
MRLSDPNADLHTAHFPATQLESKDAALCRREKKRLCDASAQAQPQKRSLYRAKMPQQTAEACSLVPKETCLQKPPERPESSTEHKEKKRTETEEPKNTAPKKNTKVETKKTEDRKHVRPHHHKHPKRHDLCAFELEIVEHF